MPEMNRRQFLRYVYDDERKPLVWNEADWDKADLEPYLRCPNSRARNIARSLHGRPPRAR